MISFPAPAMCQGEDEDLVIRIGKTLFPGQIDRLPDENGLRLWVEGDPARPEAPGEEALATFQTALGLLRVWRREAGQLEEERRRGLGIGTVRDRSGNQWVALGPVMSYESGLDELDELVACAARAIPSADCLRSALWLLGRSSPDAAEFFMIFEHACMDPALGGEQRLASRLEFPDGWAKDFKLSAHNLAPQVGGRHAMRKYEPPWSLAELREATAELLRRWIRYVSKDEAG